MSTLPDEHSLPDAGVEVRRAMLQRLHPSDPQQRVAVLDRYIGCLLGGAVGDALGAPVEFASRDEILWRHGPAGLRDYVAAYGRLGAITDDTQMTLFTAEGLMRAWVRRCMRGIGPVFAPVTDRAYARWLKTQSETQEPNATPDG